MPHIRWAEPEDVISCFYAPFLVEPALFPVATTMDPFLSQLSSLMDDPDLCGMNLDSIQLFPETQLNFAPVQLFPDIQPDFLHQAPLCDPDQSLVPGYSLAPLPTFPDSVEQTPSVSLPINQDSVQQTPSASLPINQDSVEQTGMGSLLWSRVWPFQRSLYYCIMLYVVGCSMAIFIGLIDLVIHLMNNQWGVLAIYTPHHIKENAHTSWYNIG